MAKLLSIRTEHGDVVVAAARAGETITAVGLLDDGIEKIEGSLTDLMSVLAAVSDSTHAALSKAQHPPATAEIEFGLQFTAKGNVYVVATESAASIKVTVTHKLG